MIIREYGSQLDINNRTFVIGAYVKATWTEYKGLKGKIIEIRTDKDMDTVNRGPDIYVNFGDGEVIMAEEMLVIL